MARRDKHHLGRALGISMGLHLAVLSLQFGISGKGWPALGWSWGEREASVPLPARRVELRAGPVEVAVKPSSPLPVDLPVARTTATALMPQTLIVTLRPPPLPAPVPAPVPLPVTEARTLPHAVPQTVAARVHKKIRGKKGSPILSVARAPAEDAWVVAPRATGDLTGKTDKKPASSEPTPAPISTPLPASLAVQTTEVTPHQPVPVPAPAPDATTLARIAEAEAEAEARLRAQAQQALRARERAEEAQRQLAEQAEAERVAARALQRQHDAEEARAQAQADEVRRKAEQDALAKKAAEEAARAEAAALRQRAEAQAKEAREREQARQEQERLRLAAAAQARAEEENRKTLEAARIAEAQRREAQRLAEQQKAAAQAAAEARVEAAAQAKSRAEAAAQSAREEATRREQARQQALAEERERTAAAAASATTSAATTLAGKTDATRLPARSGASLASQALERTRRGLETLPAPPPADKNAPPEPARRTSFLGRNPSEIQLSFYGDSWEEKIRRIGNINYPRIPRDAAYSAVVVSVRIRSDGHLESVSIVRSSGHRELDNATRRIIEMCSPFAAFPPDLRRSFDVIEVRRTLSFPEQPPLFISP